MNLPYRPNAQSLIPFNICFQGFARMLLTRSVDPSDFLETSWDHMAGNSAKSRTVMFWFSRVDFSYSLDIFCTLCILFFGLAFVCFVLVCLLKHVLLITFDLSVSLIIRQTSTATATSTLAVSVRYNFIHFFAVLLQSKTWKGHILRRDRELQW